MDIVFMGTPEFSVPALEALIEYGHRILAVVTQPDKPKGRGKHLSISPVKKLALEKSIPVYQPKKVRDAEFVQVLEQLAPQVIVVVAFGQILPKEILNLPPFGCINVHASLLPKLRGAAPIQWAIINGEERTGITTMWMDEGVDTGDMLFKEEVKIEKEETGESLHDKLSALGGKMIIKTLDALQSGNYVRTAQSGESSYAPILKKTLGEINWQESAHYLERRIRGLNPWPSAYTYYRGKTLKIWKASVNETAAAGFSPGEIVRVTKSIIEVQTGDGVLCILEVQPEGKNKMSCEAYLRGTRVKAGELLQRKEVN